MTLAHRRRSRRHGAEVISDKLLEALDRWPDAFDSNDRDAIGLIRNTLGEIADGER